MTNHQPFLCLSTSGSVIAWSCELHPTNILDKFIRMYGKTLTNLIIFPILINNGNKYSVFHKLHSIIN